LKSSTPYIVKDMRDVGEVPYHDLEFLRSLIIGIGMFFDLVNVIEKTFKIPLLQKKLSLSFCLSLEFFVCSCTWFEEDKMYYLSLIVTSSENDKSECSLELGNLQILLTFRVWYLETWVFTIWSKPSTFLNIQLL